MQTMRVSATLVTLASVALSAPAHAGEHYSFPSPGGLQLSGAPNPAFALPAPAPATGSFAYGTMRLHGNYDPPPPLPLPSLGRTGDAQPYQFMSHTLATAGYANYAADQARIFAPGHAVGAWTARVFGRVEPGFGAVDGWTAAAYGLGQARGRRGSSAPDLSLTPSKFGPHPELEQSPVFSRGND